MTTYADLRKLSTAYRASVIKSRAKALFFKLGTGDLKDIIARLSDEKFLNHEELDKINAYLFQLEGVEPPKEQTDPEELAKLKKLARDVEL